MEKLKSFTKKTKDNKEIRITVEEIENGFLIIRTKEWEDKNGWNHECKKIYSETNPIEFSENKELADLVD